MTDNQEFSNTDVASLFDARSEEALLPEERVILTALLSKNDRVDLAIPDNMNSQDLWDALQICSRVFVRVRRASGQLKLLIGRALVVIQNNPSIYEEKGFRSFDAFISDDTRGLPFITGISRSELFKAKSTALGLGPTVSLSDIQEIGFGKAQMIAGASEPGSKMQQRLIEKAKKITIPQLREQIAVNNIVETKNDLEWDVFQIPVTKTQKKFFEDFFSNPRVRAFCETTSYGVIMERMIAEVQEDWNVRVMVYEAESRNI